MMNASNAWRMMVLSYVSLLALMLASTFINAPEAIEGQSELLQGGLFFWGLKSLPLLLFIPGLMKRSHYAAAWLSYASMLYFVIIISFSSGYWLWAQASVIFILFMSSMLFTRWQKADEKSKENDIQAS